LADDNHSYFMKGKHNLLKNSINVEPFVPTSVKHLGNLMIIMVPFVATDTDIVLFLGLTILGLMRPSSHLGQGSK